MALPHLIKFAYNHGTEEVVRRGKKIHAIGFVDLVDHDDLMGSVVFRVRDDAYTTFYKVYIQKYKDEKAMNLRCSCPYNLGDICRHEVAALFQLQDLLERNILGVKQQAYDQRHTVLKMKTIELKTLRTLAAPQALQDAEQFLRTHKASILSAKDDRVQAEVTMGGTTWPVVLQKNEERNFDTSCTCGEAEHPLCEHKAIVFLQLLNAYGPQYFDSIRNLDREKGKLLSMYGYALTDAWQDKFEFLYKEGKPFLRVLDPTIKRVEPSSLRKPEPVTPANSVAGVAGVDVAPPPAAAPKRLGVVFNNNSRQFPYLSIDVVKGEADEENDTLVGTVEKLDVSKFVEINGLSEADQQLLQLLRRLQPAEISKFVNRNSPFAGIWENILQNEDEDLPPDTRQLITDYMLPRLQKLFTDHNVPFFVLHKGKDFTTRHLVPVTASSVFLHPAFELRAKKTKWEWCYLVKLNGATVEVQDNEWNCPLLLLLNGELRTWQKPEDALLADECSSKGNPLIGKKDLPAFLEKTALRLSRDYSVTFDPALIREVKSGEPDVSLQLQERGDYLVLQPRFSYKGYAVRPGDKDEIILPQDDGLILVHRNREKEQEFLGRIENLHSQFIRPEGGSQLALKGADVLRNNWFFLFVDAMKEMKVPVEGWDVLKNFRFNTARPRTQIFISNGMDWFDAKVDVLFGDQRVTINEVKKALQNKQSFVQLQDGTLGVLPDEWIKKYSLLFRLGENKQEHLRLSRYHISVIDELYENRDETELLIELEEKYERLREFKRIRKVAPPAVVQPILRPYQETGFHWLNFLAEVGWGGILADDMGLGKTIQALSFLQHVREQQGSLRALVACPTTLMYNWENEIRKFTPELRFHIHHGAQRSRDKQFFEAFEVVITTYGTLRSDIKLLSEQPFDVVILDESQAIKNPQSKVAKAACLLKSRHRLCMSGTPLQNNTFDIYAQMNFLNPGMLGTVEHFRNEFATPIDKFGEKEQKDHLRKLLFPFILRRTKEQVAKDLPEKTETVLYCEMDNAQRRIYDAYRNEYRSKILGTIEEVGIGGSQLTILQGLMKLRQICDSPAILNETEKLPNDSIKLEELARELEENMGNHKALVFSQFLGMLALIREKLIELQIPFVYFDGSTPAPERERAVREFQENENIRVFLISLKAGGVGLNLTAASYVYIVDPWWNPAVEQQAIDRTHRIGQTNNIFAYRMICKDTIEDKILVLQERKRALAKDLITDDTGFVKSLTREDVEYLFS
ncbi:MAG TPA: SNF2-related protein [Lacibacter sp.]|nr:SNF2-related protein [Lacibacter sp.]HMO90424.1 SNF2-related protein [Lacibacter sp.]HMP86720.1 SNF2-related protein [Lacibacter sp.]